jgi:hypothetical protein
MAKFKSRYTELGFYCCDELLKFYNGEYSTDKECEIKVLEKLADVERIDVPEPKKEKTPAKPKK